MTLRADDSQELKWYIDAALAVHPDMKSHPGSILIMGEGTVISESTKQKANAKSTAESELFTVDYNIGKILWSKRFIEY